MKSFRNPKYLERYEDVVFDLEQAINVAPANNTDQERNNLKFLADNSGDVTPFDWYNARIALDLKVQQRDGTDFAIGANVNDVSLTANRLAQIIAYEADQMGIVNGANSFISRLSVLANGKELHQCNYANHSVNKKIYLSITNPTLIVWQQMNFIFLIRLEELIKIDLLEEMLLIDKTELTLALNRQV